MLLASTIAVVTGAGSPAVTLSISSITPSKPSGEEFGVEKSVIASVMVCAAASAAASATAIVPVSGTRTLL